MGGVIFLAVLAAAIIALILSAIFHKKRTTVVRSGPVVDHLVKGEPFPEPEEDEK